MSDTKRESTISPSWTLQCDMVERYSFQLNAFTAEECDRIIEIGNSYALEQGNLLQKNEVDDEVLSIRDSKVVFLAPTEDMIWVYRRLTDVVLNLNSLFYNFDLFGFNENLQFTEYKAPAGKYDYHIDKAHKGPLRKLSIVLQLTDPDTYEGGDFQVMDSGEPETLKRERGTLLAFPSYTLHRVTPVTSGTRNSLVGWISGPQFK